MPELPEVQTIVNELNKSIVGQEITKIWLDAPQIIKEPTPREWISKLKGSKILGIRRRAKNILIDLRDDNMLLVHLKMTGHFLVGKWRIVNGVALPVSPAFLKERVNRYVHLILYLKSGLMLGLSDMRKFAKVVFGKRDDIELSDNLRELGPEPLDPKFTFAKFSELIGAGKKNIKQVLMDQGVISGIGNIYSDDILWAAKISPLKTAHALNLVEKKNMWTAMKRILRKAIKLRGTSISDYRDPMGQLGSYADARLVYRREGEACKRCDSKIKRIKIGGRSAHYCPRCQIK